MPTLFVSCRTCGREVPSPVAEPTPGPSGVMISGLSVRCPSCGNESPYSTADFHLPTVADPAPIGTAATAQEDLASEHAAKLKGAQEKFAGLGIVPPEERSPHEG